MASELNKKLQLAQIHTWYGYYYDKLNEYNKTDIKYYCFNNLPTVNEFGHDVNYSGVNLSVVTADKKTHLITFSKKGNQMYVHFEDGTPKKACNELHVAIKLILKKK